MVTDLIIPGFALPPEFESLLAITYSVFLILFTTSTMVFAWKAVRDAHRSHLRGEPRYSPSIIRALTAVAINVAALFLVIFGLVQIPYAYVLLIFIYIAFATLALFMCICWAMLSHLDKRAIQRHN